MLWSFSWSKYAYLSAVQYIPHPATPQLWSMKQMERVRFAMSETLIVASQFQDGIYNDFSEKMAPFVKIKPKKLFSVGILCLWLTNSMQYVNTLSIMYYTESLCIYLFGYCFYLIFGQWTKHYLDPKNCNALMCLLHIVV
jgi:hypothetical protein